MFLCNFERCWRLYGETRRDTSPKRLSLRRVRDIRNSLLRYVFNTVNSVESLGKAVDCVADRDDGLSALRLPGVQRSTAHLRVQETGAFFSS